MKIVTLTLCLLSLLLSVTVMADQRCRSVDIRFENNVPRSIKILKFEYFDDEDDKWRTENVWNFFQIVGATSGVVEETLEYVGNEPIPLFRVHYKWCGVQDSNGQCDSWQRGSRVSRQVAAVPNVARCTRNMNITIPINQ
ncbi:MAG: hypothetical protein AAF542_23215 [Pseudomonadota bacterium]